LSGADDGSQKVTAKKRQPVWVKTFLEALRRCGNRTKAAALAGISRRAVYKHLKKDPDFKEVYEDALDEASDKLEEIAWARAEEGSDVLLIFLLKALRPWKYRERYGIEHTGTGPGGAIRYEVEGRLEHHVDAEPDCDRLATIFRILADAGVGPGAQEAPAAGKDG
jgi:AcrR family transcriptional regulator